MSEMLHKAIRFRFCRLIYRANCPLVPLKETQVRQRGPQRVEDALRRKPAVTNVPFAPYEYARVLVIVCCPMDLSADEALEFSEWFGDCLQLQSAGSLAFVRHRRDDSSVVCASVQVGWHRRAVSCVVRRPVH
jgi:hypothetical protein